MGKWHVGFCVLEGQSCSVCPGWISSSPPPRCSVGHSVTGPVTAACDPVTPSWTLASRATGKLSLLLGTWAQCLEALQPLCGLEGKAASGVWQSRETEGAWVLSEASHSCIHPGRPPPAFLWDGAAIIDEHKCTLHRVKPRTAECPDTCVDRKGTLGMERRSPGRERAVGGFRHNGHTAQEEEGGVLATLPAGPGGPQEERQASGQE